MQGRIKLGLIVPSSNTTVEWDFRRLMPPLVSLHGARMWLTGAGAEGLPRMNEDMERCAEHLGSAGLDFIVYACTGGSLLEGPGHDTRIAARITEIAGVPATTVSTAARLGLSTLGLRRLSLCTPYQDSMTAKVADYLAASGYEVVSMAGRRKADNLAIGDDPPDEIVDFVAANAAPDCDGLFLSCTNWRAAELCQRIEDRTGKPVVAANQATAWATRHRLGLDAPLDGCGRLLRLAPAAPAEAAAPVAA